MKRKTVPYGHYIKIKEKNMHVSLSGSGENVILLLPGLGSVCPIIEMKALSSYLQDKYKVVTIEYLGYGMSDNATQERTIENIVDDIHEAMNVLGFHHYAIAGHSIAGLYCLMYVNKYSDEVTHFIGIDISVPQQIDSFKAQFKKMLANKLQIMESKPFYLPFLVRLTAKRFLKRSSPYKYSRKDLSIYSKMGVKALYKGSVVNELQNVEYNFSIMQGTKFPDEVSVLLLTASQSNEQYPNWFQWHEELLNQSGVIETITGSHILHLENPKLIAEKINIFLEKS